MCCLYVQFLYVNFFGDLSTGDSLRTVALCYRMRFCTVAPSVWSNVGRFSGRTHVRPWSRSLEKNTGGLPWVQWMGNTLSSTSRLQWQPVLEGFSIVLSAIVDAHSRFSVADLGVYGGSRVGSSSSPPHLTPKKQLLSETSLTATSPL